MAKQRLREMAHVSLWVKYAMVFMNIIFFFLGAAILMFGIWGIYSKEIDALTSVVGEGTASVDPLWILIVTGAVVVVLSTFGCIGALRENTCMLKLFKYAIILILIIELVTGVLCYLYQDKVIESVENFVSKSMVSYHDDPDTQFIIDTLQEYLQCCGINEPRDWEVNLYYSCNNTNRSITKCSVPFSCCVIEEEGVVNYQCGYGALNERTPDPKIIHTTGCKEATIIWLMNNLIFLAIVIGAMVLLQFTALMLSCSVIGDIRWIKDNYW